MADFKIALSKLLELEGGYVNNPHDSGGETYAGITRVNNPSWAGWSLIDGLRQEFPSLTQLNKELSSSMDLAALVQSFYNKAYWDFDTIESQDIATKIFSINVNFGKSKGIRLLQTALSKLGEHVVVDGALGEKTLTAMNRANPERLLRQLTLESILAHVRIVMYNQSQDVFLEGWIKRDIS